MADNNEPPTGRAAPSPLVAGRVPHNGPASTAATAATEPPDATCPLKDSQATDVEVSRFADDSLLTLLPHRSVASHDGACQPAPADGSETSCIETTAVEPSRLAEETITEEAVREHLKDVESSFLTAASPLPLASPAGTQAPPNEAQGTSLTSGHSPELPDRDQPPALGADSSAIGNTTSSLENLDSSPLAAAAARSILRATNTTSASQPDGTASVGDSDGDDLANDSFLQANADASEPTAASPAPSYAQPERLDAGSTPGHSLRASKRPRFLRSRFGSQRSSTSSITNPDSHDESDLTAGMGLDYALHSGGAVPPPGSSRLASGNNPLRSISFGSMASGFITDDQDTPAHPLATLTETESPPPPTRNGDLVRTPESAHTKLNAVPTDTVIAQHVKNVQVPESLVKEYRFKSELQTPRRPNSTASVTGTAARTGRSLTLKEQSSTIERLSKENFDLKLKVMFLSDRLDKLSEEGIKEMISENVDLKTNLAILQRDNKLLRKRVKELEKQAKEDDQRPNTSQSGASSADQTARMDDDESREREQELLYLRERVEEYAVEIERLRNESLTRESEKRKMAEAMKNFRERGRENLGRQEEDDVWNDLLEQETTRREQADEENRRLRGEIFRLKKESSSGPGAMHHNTNIYNITKKNRDQPPAPSRPLSVLSGPLEGSHAGLSAATTLVEELRREGEQLRYENAELRREVGAQTSMLTSRNREKDRLYQEIEDLKMSQRRIGAAAPSTVDSLLDKSASRAGHERSQSRGSGKTGLAYAGDGQDNDDDPEREALEARLAEARDKLSEVKLQNQELQRELQGCMADFETAVAGKRQAEEATVALQADLDAAMNDLVTLQSERDDALREQGEVEHEFEALRQEAQQEIDTLEAEADQRNDEMRRLEADLRDRSENFDALQEEMRNLSEALVRLEDEQDGKMCRIAQLEGELESSGRESEELEQKLVEANEKTQRLSVQQESLQGEISFLREEQEADMIRIGDLEAALAQCEKSLQDEKVRTKELDERLQQERAQRELVADREKEEVQQFVNELNREASSAKDEVKRLRKSLSSREVEATEWKEKLIELENNLREAFGDLNGTRSSLLKSIAKMQRELEDTVRELDTCKASLVEKDRIIKQRDALLESHALESLKVAELLDKERSAHRNTRAQFETFQKSHHMSQAATTQDVRIAELETTRNQERRKLAALEQKAREQLTERNELLLGLWHKLSALCGREWMNNNAPVDRIAVPSVEVIASRLPGFSKNLMAAMSTVETLHASLRSKIEAVERDLWRDYRALERNLELRTKKLDRLESMARNSVAFSTPLAPSDPQSRYHKLEEAYRQLKVEYTTLRQSQSQNQSQDPRTRASHSSSDGTSACAGGSPSPLIPRGPGDRDRSHPSRAGGRDRLGRPGGSTRPGAAVAAATTAAAASDFAAASTSSTASAHDHLDVALTAGEGGAGSNENRWLFRLRDMEFKLKMEREGRNQDRQAARQRLGGLEMENRDLRDRMRRTQSEAG